MNRSWQIKFIVGPFGEISSSQCFFYRSSVMLQCPSLSSCVAAIPFFGCDSWRTATGSQNRHLSNEKGKLGTIKGIQIYRGEKLFGSKGRLIQIGMLVFRESVFLSSQFWLQHGAPAKVGAVNSEQKNSQMANQTKRHGLNKFKLSTKSS